MNPPLYRDLGAGDAGSPVQLAVVGVDVSVRATNQLPVDVALTLTNARRFSVLGKRALVALHAVMGQTGI